MPSFVLALVHIGALCPRAASHTPYHLQRKPSCCMTIVRYVYSLHVHASSPRSRFRQPVLCELADRRRAMLSTFAMLIIPTPMAVVLKCEIIMLSPSLSNISSY